MNIFWMSVSLGALGFAMSASWSSVISLGGKYTGSVSGWINLWGNIGGVLAPIVTAFFVTNWSTAPIWPTPCSFRRALWSSDGRWTQAACRYPF